LKSILTLSQSDLESSQDRLKLRIVITILRLDVLLLSAKGFKNRSFLGHPSLVRPILISFVCNG